ncbi:MAG: hypothetical protein J6Q24_02820 [Clostridia bacterium]|nr:hypothetical protein [Clostridia bacterium]
MTENINDKIRAFLHKNAGYLIVLVVSAAYVATSVLGLNESGKSLMRILGDGIVAFIVGCAINIVLGLQGIMNGERDERFISTVDLHGSVVEKITPYIESLDDWCDRRNRENLVSQRTRILTAEGMKYSDYFDEDGGAREFKFLDVKGKDIEQIRAERRRYRTYRKAVRLKLTPMTAGELTSEGSKCDDPYNFGRTIEQYERQTGRSELVSRVLTAAVFGYYSVSLIADFSYDKLIWNILQVAVFLISGTVKMYNSFLFITGEYRGRIVKKVNALEMFYNDINKEKKDEQSESYVSGQ